MLLRATTRLAARATTGASALPQLPTLSRTLTLRASSGGGGSSSSSTLHVNGSGRHLLPSVFSQRSGFTRSLCQATASSDGAADSSSPAGSAASFAPSYSRRARRERLHMALAQAAAGGAFEVPKPEPRDLPGPCGAVMNVLTERGPLTSGELYEAVEARYPGVTLSKTHLKQHILKRALANKLMKVQLGDAKHKDRWALRKPGQIRMKIARVRHRN